VAEEDGVPDVAAGKVPVNVPTLVAGLAAPTSVLFIFKTPVYKLGLPLTPVVVAVREKLSVPALKIGMPIVDVWVALLEVTEVILNGRTENESVEQAVDVPSLIIATSFLYAELIVKAGDCFWPLSVAPLANDIVWVPPVTAVLL
jgi:hypothetical protein